MAKQWAHFPFSPAKLPFFYGWGLLALGALGVLMSVPAQTVGVSVFTDFLIDALGLTRGRISAAYMLGTLGSACLLPWAGKLYDRLGSRSSAALACVSLSLMLIFLSRSDRVGRMLADATGLSAANAAFLAVFLGFFGLRFWGQGVLTLASHSMVAKWFDRRRGLASGLSGMLVTLGLFNAPLGLNVLIDRLGWRAAWVALAALVGGGFTLVVLALFRDNPEDCGLRPDGAPARHDSPGDSVAKPEAAWTRGQAVRTRAFWGFSLGFALHAMFSTGLIFHVVSVFESAEMTRSQAVAIFFPISLLAMGLHLPSGWLSDRLPLNRLLLAMLGGVAVSSGGLAILGPGLPVGMVIVGSGLTIGLFGLLSAVAWAKLFGLAHLGSIAGLNMSLVVLSSAIGPVLFSQSLAWTGSYRPVGAVVLAVCLLLMVNAMRMKLPSRVHGASEQ